MLTIDESLHFREVYDILIYHAHEIWSTIWWLIKAKIEENQQQYAYKSEQGTANLKPNTYGTIKVGLSAAIM